MQTKRVARIALLDPIDEIAYSRPVRRGARYTEDVQLQTLVWDKGLDKYQGVIMAVLVE